MATKIKYTGLANIRQLLVSDLEKWGVEIKSKLHFPHNEAVEVEDDVADAVLENLPGEFEKHVDEPKTTTDAPATDSAATAGPSSAATSSPTQ
jgi:hypothetical protein